MAKDLTETIDAVRSMTIGRCRERIEQAARKTRGLLRNEQQDEQNIEQKGGEDQYGVSSLLKRRHGL